MAEEPAGNQLALAADVARRYYLLEESKSDIGASLGISRFKVARLLALARETGVVRIEIREPGASCDDLAAELTQAYRLRRSAVVGVGNAAPEAARESVARVAAAELDRVLQPGDVLGLPWSRTVSAMLRATHALPGVSVVQLCGSLVIPGEDSPVDVVRAAGRLGGGESHVFYAPLIADDPDSAVVLRRQPSVAAALAAADEVTVAVTSVGAWSPGQSTVHDFVSPTERRAVAATGAVGEVLGILFDDAGEPVAADLSRRLVGITWQQLRGVDRVVTLAQGAAKARATHALLSSGLVHTLVCDDELARTLLDLQRDLPAPLQSDP